MTQEFTIELDPRVRVASELVRGGSLEGWKDMAVKVVALPAMPHWRLALIAAPVGAIVDFLQLPSCGINFSGETSIGKTTAQIIACSMWSLPLPRDGTLFFSANTTANAFELMAARSNGSILVVDELAMKTGKDLQDLIFRFTGNRSKGRLTRDSEARLGWDWRTFAMLSSEQTIEAKIRGDRNATWTAGTAVRILDIGIDGQVAKLPKAMVDEIQTLARTNYGYAGEEMVRALLRIEENKLRELSVNDTQHVLELRRQREAASGVISTPVLAGAVTRAAEVFGLIRMAGRIAVKIKLLPKEIDVDGTVAWGFDTFLATGGVALDPAGQAVEALRLWVAKNWEVTIQHADALLGAMSGMAPGNPRAAEAWYDADAVYIPAEDIARLARSELTGSAIAAELKRRGMLYTPKLEKGKNFTRRVPNRRNQVTAYPIDRRSIGPS